MKIKHNKESHIAAPCLFLGRVVSLAENAEIAEK